MSKFSELAVSGLNGFRNNQAGTRSVFSKIIENEEIAKTKNEIQNGRKEEKHQTF